MLDPIIVKQLCASEWRFFCFSKDDVKYPEQKSIFVVVHSKNCEHADNKSGRAVLKGINFIHVQKVFADEFVSNTARLPIRLFAW